MDAFTINGTDYHFDKYGVLHQSAPIITMKYDQDYVRTRYDTIPNLTHQMSLLRAGMVIGAMGRIPRSLADVGFGNGAFLSVMGEVGVRTRVGVEISGYSIPNGCTLMSQEELAGREWDLVTFFDSLEHLQSLWWTRDIQSKYIAITVPWLHWELGQEWFRTWKHRRPGEHLHHFSPESLGKFMLSLGYRSVAMASIEDLIRKPDGDLPNTFTSVFLNDK